MRALRITTFDTPPRRVAALVATAIAGVWIGVVASAPALARPTPRPGVRGALLISVDGLRPDLALKGATPAIHGLMARGSYSFSALTTDMAVTLPSHTSMVTGVPPDSHQVTWNGDPPPGSPTRPAWPTLFELAHAAGYRTGMVAGKSKFVVLDVPGSLDRSFVPVTTVTTDSVVADTALAWIDRDAPAVMFVHLPSVDIAGHTFGWGSDQQMAAIAFADQCIGRMLAALERKHRLESTVVLVTSDHGGSGKSHGAGVPQSLNIPWVVAGPGIRSREDLATDGSRVVHTEDSFATLCFELGLAVPKNVTGRVVDAALTGARAGSRAVGAGH